MLRWLFLCKMLTSSVTYRLACLFFELIAYEILDGDLSILFFLS